MESKAVENNEELNSTGSTAEVQNTEDPQMSQSLLSNDSEDFDEFVLCEEETQHALLNHVVLWNLCKYMNLETLSNSRSVCKIWHDVMTEKMLLRRHKIEFKSKEMISKFLDSMKLSLRVPYSCFIFDNVVNFTLEDRIIEKFFTRVQIREIYFKDALDSRTTISNKNILDISTLREILVGYIPNIEAIGILLPEKYAKMSRFILPNHTPKIQFKNLNKLILKVSSRDFKTRFLSEVIKCSMQVEDLKLIFLGDRCKKNIDTCLDTILTDVNRYSINSLSIIAMNYKLGEGHLSKLIQMCNSLSLIHLELCAIEDFVNFHHKIRELFLLLSPSLESLSILQQIPHFHQMPVMEKLKSFRVLQWFNLAVSLQKLLKLIPNATNLDLTTTVAYSSEVDWNTSTPKDIKPHFLVENLNLQGMPGRIRWERIMRRFVYCFPNLTSIKLKANDEDMTVICRNLVCLKKIELLPESDLNDECITGISEEHCESLSHLPFSLLMCFTSPEKIIKKKKPGIRNLEHLEHFSVGISTHDNMTDLSIVLGFYYCPKLKNLFIPDSKLTDNGLKFIDQNFKLHLLDVSRCMHITDFALLNLKNRIKTLSVSVSSNSIRMTQDRPRRPIVKFY